MTSWREAHKGRTLQNDAPGFYKLSLAKGAPDVGALIYIPCPIEMNPEFWNHLDRPWHLRAMINGRDVDVWKIGGYAAERIAKAEYEYLIAVRQWDAQYDPQSPGANPYCKVTSAPKSAQQPNARPTINIRDIPVSNFMP